MQVFTLVIEKFGVAWGAGAAIMNLFVLIVASVFLHPIKRAIPYMA